MLTKIQLDQVWLHYLGKQVNFLSQTNIKFVFNRCCLNIFRAANESNSRSSSRNDTPNDV